jgi:mannose-6-phosphate isomerase
MKLDTVFVEKPWGRTDLPAHFATEGRKIGEVWFPPPPDGEDLLVKHIFTSEKLSVQVHPNDDQARARGLPRGKEECWYVTGAEPGGCLGIGLRESLSPEEVREAAASGAIEALMDWKPVAAGDFFYIPAGTVHAIGAGITLVEVQQNSDVTYRLYDYGRPRELHLDDAVTVAQAAPYPDTLYRHVTGTQTELLVEGPYFHLAFCKGEIPALAGFGPTFLIPISGLLRHGEMVAESGECVAADNPLFWQADPDASLLVARSAQDIGTL